MSIANVIQKLTMAKAPPIPPVDYLEALIQSGEVKAYLPSSFEEAATEAGFSRLIAAIKTEDDNVGTQIEKLSLAEKQRLLLLHLLQESYPPVPKKMSDSQFSTISTREGKDAAFIGNEFISRDNKILLTYMLILFNTADKPDLHGLQIRLKEAFEMNLSLKELRKQLAEAAEKSPRSTAESEAMEANLDKAMEIFRQDYDPVRISQLQAAIQRIREFINEEMFFKELDKRLKEPSLIREGAEKILSEYQSRIYMLLSDVIQKTKGEFVGIPPAAMHYMLEYLINDYHKRTKQHFDAEMFYRENKDIDDNVINKLLLRQGADSRPFGLDKQDSRFNPLALAALAKGGKVGIGETLFYHEEKLRRATKEGWMDGIGAELSTLVSKVFGSNPDAPDFPLDADSIKRLDELYTIGQDAYNRKHPEEKIAGWKSIEPGPKQSKNELKPLIWKALLTLSPNAKPEDKFNAYLDLIDAYLPPRAVIPMLARRQDIFLFPLRCITQAQYLLNHQLSQMTDKSLQERKLEEKAIELVHDAIHAPIPDGDKRKLLNEIQVMLAAVQPLATVKTDRPNVYTFLHKDVTTALEKEDKKKELEHLQQVIQGADDQEDVILEREKAEKLQNELLNPVQVIDMTKWACCERGGVKIGAANVAQALVMAKYAIAIAKINKDWIPKVALPYLINALATAEKNISDFTKEDFAEMEKVLSEANKFTEGLDTAEQQRVSAIFTNYAVTQLQASRKLAAQPATDIDVGVATVADVADNAPTKTTPGDEDMPLQQFREPIKLFSQILVQQEFLDSYAPEFKKHITQIMQAMGLAQTEEEFAAIFGKTSLDYLMGDEGLLSKYVPHMGPDADPGYKLQVLSSWFEKSSVPGVEQAVKADLQVYQAKQAQSAPVETTQPATAELETDSAVEEFKKMFLQDFLAKNKSFFAEHTPSFNEFVVQLQRDVRSANTNEQMVELLKGQIAEEKVRLEQVLDVLAGSNTLYKIQMLEWFFEGSQFPSNAEMLQALAADKAVIEAAPAVAEVQGDATEPQQTVQAAPKQPAVTQQPQVAPTATLSLADQIEQRRRQMQERAAKTAAESAVTQQSQPAPQKQATPTKPVGDMSQQAADRARQMAARQKAAPTVTQKPKAEPAEPEWLVERKRKAAEAQAQQQAEQKAKETEQLKAQEAAQKQAEESARQEAARQQQQAQEAAQKQAEEAVQAKQKQEAQQKQAAEHKASQDLNSEFFAMMEEENPELVRDGGFSGVYGEIIEPAFSADTTLKKLFGKQDNDSIADILKEVQAIRAELKTAKDIEAKWSILLSRKLFGNEDVIEAIQANLHVIEDARKPQPSVGYKTDRPTGLEHPTELYPDPLPSRPATSDEPLQPQSAAQPVPEQQSPTAETAGSQHQVAESTPQPMPGASADVTEPEPDITLAHDPDVTFKKNLCTAMQIAAERYQQWYKGEWTGMNDTEKKKFGFLRHSDVGQDRVAKLIANAKGTGADAFTELCKFMHNDESYKMGFPARKTGSHAHSYITFLFRTLQGDPAIFSDKPQLSGSKLSHEELQGVRDYLRTQYSVQIDPGKDFVKDQDARTALFADFDKRLPSIGPKL